MERELQEREQVVAPRRKLSLRHWSLVAAALFVAGGSLAATDELARWSSPPAPQPVRAVAAPVKRALGAAVRRSSSAPNPVLVAAPPAAAATSLRAQPAPKPRPPVPPSVPAGGVTAVGTLPVVASEPAAAPTRNSEPAALFDRAAAARTRGDYAQALALYRNLERRYPGSDEARASRAITARLLLDTGKTRAALDDYNRYLAGAPAVLTEESLVGRALAYQRLGRSADERSAWSKLLSDFPRSVHAARARARLGATRDSPPR